MIIADPLELISAGVGAWLLDETDLVLVPPVANGMALLDRLRLEPIDLVLLEVSLPGLDGIDTMRAVRHEFPAQKVLAFSSLREIEYVNSMLIEGALGYLLKDSPRDELIRAVRTTLKGERYLSMDARTSIEQGYRYTGKRPESEYIGLTLREREIIRMIAQECTNTEIASALFITEDTVKTHRKNLLTKLNVRTSAGLVKYAMDRRWV